MRRILTLLPIVLLFLASSIDAQVNSVNYLLQFNCESNLYELKIKIIEGSATGIGERAQFNSQVTIVVPTGKPLVIEERFFPIENNQNYDGDVPNNWSLATPVLAPMGLAEFDFYSVAPKVAPTSFYNDLEEGDEVTLFSFSLGVNTEFDINVRLFDNFIDTNMSSFEGADLRNGFTMGGTNNLYDGNIHRSCTATSTERITHEDFSVYPNPAIDKINIDVPSDTKSIKLINVYGIKLQEIKNPKSGINTINVEKIDTGVYYILLDLGKHHLTKSISIQ